MFHVALRECCITNPAYVKIEKPWSKVTGNLRKQVKKKIKCSIMICFGVFCTFWDRYDEHISGEISPILKLPVSSEIHGVKSRGDLDAEAGG